MERYLATAVILLAGVWVSAPADACSGTRLDEAQILSRLEGMRVEAVAPGGVQPDGEGEWKEDHCLNHELWKVGDTSAEDPPAKRGTWSVIGAGADARVRYDYDGDSSYEWSLWDEGAGLCWGDPADDHTIATGSVVGSSGACR